jgi:NAD(P)-dependent dehydrogenase (short-subunit alcohol dehydrogenase family)
MAESVVVVTGALTGICEAAAKALAQRGDIVVISGRHDDLGAQLADDLKAAGAIDAVFVRADVRSGHELAHLIDTTITSFGRPDIAVNNAGTEGIMAR